MKSSYDTRARGAFRETQFESLDSWIDLDDELEGRGFESWAGQRFFNSQHLC